jgi:hypothetical protein
MLPGWSALRVAPEVLSLRRLRVDGQTVELMH